MKSSLQDDFAHRPAIILVALKAWPRGSPRGSGGFRSSFWGGFREVLRRFWGGAGEVPRGGSEDVLGRFQVPPEQRPARKCGRILRFLGFDEQARSRRAD